MEENSLKLQGQTTNLRDASTCADPGFAWTRAPLSMTSLKQFGKLRHYYLFAGCLFTAALP
jgi:hypothetical protein